jgi:hypothetical protein
VVTALLRAHASGAAVAALLATGALAGCGGGDAAQPAAPVGGLRTSFHDDVKPLSGDRIAWSTTWRLCWEPRAGATGYELRTLTGEGDPGGVRRQTARCFSIEAAAGRNERAEGLRYRSEQLALAQGQLAYQIRAVLESGDRSRWSAPVPVGASHVGGR